jgi:hypothetical protein
VLEPAAVEEPEQSPWLLEFPEGKEQEAVAPAPEESPIEFTEELDGLFDEPVTAETGFAPQPEPVLVTAEPTVAAPSAMERAVAKVMESVLSCRESPLEVEIRALATDPSQTPDTRELRQMIADLDIPSHLSAQLRETLGSPDVAIALSAQSGAQGDLLVFAGQVVARLYEMPAYKDVLVTPQDNGH